MTTLVAGVDSSTQSCKVVIVDAHSGQLVRSGRAAHPPGTAVDPEAWWLALTQALAAAGGIDDVAAISIAGQQHGMVALDERGEVIRDALLWNDTRSARAAEELIAELGGEQLVHRTGLLPVASFTLSKVRWLRDAEPENARRVAAIALPHDWLSWRLAGFGPAGRSPRGPDLSALTTDRSDASGTGYWRPADNTWDHELFTAALGHDALLPRITGVWEPVGHTPEGVVIGPGAGDNAAAALGVGARRGDVIVSIGTSGTVFAVSEHPTADPSGTVAGFADATGRYLPLVATLNAARVLDTIAALLDVDHETLSALALAGTASELRLVPYFDGERTPNLPEATASLLGMTHASTTRENLARAAVVGMLSGLNAGVTALREHGVRPERALLIGGGAQSAAVRRLAPEVLGLDIQVPAPAEYVALGAAQQAARVS